MNLYIYFVNAGPGHVMDDVIDRTCVFGNEVCLNYNQTKELKILVDVIPKPKIKAFICTIMKPHISPDFKMVSSKSYCLLAVHVMCMCCYMFG